MKRNSVIEQLYRGNRPLYEGIPLSEETKRSVENFIRLDNEFRAKLKEYPDLLAMYQRTNKAMENMSSYDANDHYMEGFRFGVLLGIDIANKGFE